MAVTALQANQIRKCFGSFCAVDDLTFDVEEGEVFGLLGPNGTGKSTLIRMLTTLLKTTSGAALINGLDVVAAATRVRRSIGVIPHPPDPVRLVKLLPVIVVSALALISMMFLLMVRVNDPLVPRATFGVLNTLLYFPSGAVYPVNGFPDWMRAISEADRFTYAVHAFKELLLKNAGIAAIAFDLSFLLMFALVMMTLATPLFERSL